MPIVSVIVPCYNEQATIGLLLDSLRKQTFPPAEQEIIIADGASTDRTVAEIEQFKADHPGCNVRIISNPRRTIPAGLNLAIQAAQGEYIVRLDAHSMPSNDYVERCVANLKQGLGENVGGVWDIQPGGPGWIARSIALAASNPLGVGDARYRYTNQAGPVDTVPFGAFRRSLVGEIGYFDENRLTNADYEFNTRVRKAGKTIWLDPAIRSVYFARPDLLALARQYWRYGYWKYRMLRRYPETIRWRQALPPAFVLALLGLFFLTLWMPVFGWLLLSCLVIYGLVLLGEGLRQAGKHGDVRFGVGIPLAIMVMHFCWGGAFLWSLARKETEWAFQRT